MKRPDPLPLREVLRGLRGQLEEAGIESAGVEAERLLGHVLGIGPSRLALRAGEPLPPEAAAELARLTARRTAGEPLQHLEGTAPFRGLVLRADRRALIPRPETEQLIDLIARQLRRGPPGAAGVRTVPRPDARPPVGRALDVGTGSGAIALSLVVEGLVARAVGLDVSEEALEQARENRDLVGVTAARFEVRRTGADPFEALEDGEMFDLLVSNPPYVRDDEFETLPREVREHEPRAALAGGADGLELVRTIAAGAPQHLASGAHLFLEIGAGQGASAVAVFEADPGWSSVRLHADLAGRDRFVTARRG